jgi:predicted hydrocarbon binding protein
LCVAVVNSRIMDHSFDQASNETIDLLEARLRRIEYAVCGEASSKTSEQAGHTISDRLAELEHSLHQLAAKSKVVQDLLKLREFCSRSSQPESNGLTIIRRCQIPGAV